jgi:site-specific recombinase XerC
MGGKGDILVGKDRHSAGSIVHKMTGSMKLAQEQLGHANMATTADTYVHTDLEQLKEAGNALAHAIVGGMPTNCPPAAIPAVDQ